MDLRMFPGGSPPAATAAFLQMLLAGLFFLADSHPSSQQNPVESALNLTTVGTSSKQAFFATLVQRQVPIAQTMYDKHKLRRFVRRFVHSESEQQDSSWSLLMDEVVPDKEGPVPWEELTVNMENFLHVVSCQMDVACNLGTPHTMCQCERNMQIGSNCILPKARITHKSSTDRGVVTSFCVGVALPPMMDGRSKYDMQTRCKFWGRDDVQYRVHVTKRLETSNHSPFERKVKYTACLKPE
ncbi:uncharacterized protein LOC118429974 [Branchiostoma floridae]|uniref:Uncharacterized protein LOC118429974 n=1 Tax=Branchiostoma floridae TaxID=7739 RepID=A0A9J7NB75_BRAFL|nr:uncharacterized protein LOC118429974 [Branchiostoma floridae]XP_035696515.1 uncharacterized protein LOC118429974 [Branchiostoma floridae]